jgi:hypothetical protein
MRLMGHVRTHEWAPDWAHNVTITNNVDGEIHPQRTPYHLATHIGFEAINRIPAERPCRPFCGTRGEGRSGAARMSAS